MIVECYVGTGILYTTTNSRNVNFEESWNLKDENALLNVDMS